MFKNPLKKYAAGGVTSSQEQVLVEKFSKAASKLNIDTEVLIQKVQELTKEQQIDFMKAIQDIADKDNPSPESIQFIQSVFAKSSQAFKEGGKIHDFICKHSKGGIAGCGCKEDGGIVKSQDGNPALGLNFIQREYDGDGNAVYFLAPEKRFLPSNMRKDPGSDYQQQGGEYQGNGQVSIVDFGNGRLRINSDPYGPYGNVLHGTDSATYANRALELMKQAKMKPSTGFVNKKQRGGYLIPDMSFVSLGEVPGYSRNITEGAVFAPIVGERAIVDGNDVFIPNRQISAALVWGKDPNEVGVLEPGAGYTDKGRVAYTPAQIRARKKEGMTDTAHAQNEKGLVESNQEGGELTRKQALGLGMENKGFTRSQARFALANAKNALRESGVRGKQMRQTARSWVAGEMNKPTTAWWQNAPQVQVELPITEQAVQITPEEQANINEIFEKSLVRPYTGNFNQAFANARKDGRSLFLWNNNPYTTELAKPKASQVDFNSLPQDVQDRLTGNPGDVTIEEVPINENLVDILDERPTSIWNFMNNMDRSTNVEEASPLFTGPMNPSLPGYYYLRKFRGSYKNGGKVEKTQKEKFKNKK